MFNVVLNNLTRSRKSACILVSALIFILSGCHHEKKTTDDSANQIITVTEQSQNTTLYYSSTIKPLDIINIPSPVDGTISQIYFHYGQHVQAGDSLLSIKSPQFMQNYQDALSSYLHAKQQYLSDVKTLNTQQELYNAGLVSDNSLDSNKSTVANSKLSYLQAWDKLSAIFMNNQSYFDNNDDFLNMLRNLDLKNTEQVSTILAQGASEININSPTFGTTLQPEKDSTNSDDSNDSGSKTLTVGSAVKTGDTLLSIGDFTGLTLSINVNEVDINFIKPGQKVIVTGVGFPNADLIGYVNHVDVQAQENNNGGLPTFPVEVVIPTLSIELQKLIHAGMTAKVELILEQASLITIPLKAVFFNNGQPMVKKIDNKTNLPIDMPVTTGKTTEDSVIISKGLNVGDKILVAN